MEPCLKREKILEQQPPGVREHTLGMELYTFDGKIPVAEPHDYAGSVEFLGASTDLEMFGDAIFRNNERMIACGGQRAGGAAKDRLPIMFDAADFTVHHFTCPDYASPESGADCLMPKTDAKDGLLAGKIAEQVYADARFLGSTWAGGDQDVRRIETFDFIACDLVIAPHLNLFPQLAEVLHQVVGKGIVIVENKDHGRKQV